MEEYEKNLDIVMLTVYVDGKEYQYAKGTSYEQIATDLKDQYAHDILLVRTNRNIRELSKTLLYDKEQIEMITSDTKTGNLAYRRSVSLLAIKAINDVIGRTKLTRAVLDFSVSKGYYIDLEGDFEFNDALVEQIEARMRELVVMKLPITKNGMPIQQAIRLFEDNKMYDKVRLLKYRRVSTVNIYSLGGYRDYYYGHMVVNTEVLRYFKLYRYGHGIVVQMPEPSAPERLPEFKPFSKLFHAQNETSKWLRQLGAATVGELNDQIVSGRMNELLLTQEAIMEKSIADIAAEVVSNPGIKFVMIAGPSSSGKTTFSHRLSVQLRAHGRIPHPIAVDNYYKYRKDCPVDAEGNYDFECLEAIDVDLFNHDMNLLLSKETVELPTFNFKTGCREYNGNTLTLGDNDILVIEGIHCLNDALSHSLPKESKYKIYISALTQLNIDDHNRIPTTDVRLLRRMIRDARTRGTSAKNTIAMWNSVRRGEEQYIFPYQDDANVVFNSALVYELAVLKQFAEPLLYQITPEDEEYDEAQRLLKFLDYFLGVDSSNVPINSLLKEFVGGGCFDVG